MILQAEVGHAASGMSWVFFAVLIALMWSWRGGPRMWRRTARRGWGSDADPDAIERERARDAELDELRTRVNELENRLDFAERLLTSRSGQREGASG